MLSIYNTGLRWNLGLCLLPSNIALFILPNKMVTDSNLTLKVHLSWLGRSSPSLLLPYLMLVVQFFIPKKVYIPSLVQIKEMKRVLPNAFTAVEGIPPIMGDAPNSKLPRKLKLLGLPSASLIGKLS